MQTKFLCYKFPNIPVTYSPIYPYTSSNVQPVEQVSYLPVLDPFGEYVTIEVFPNIEFKLPIISNVVDSISYHSKSLSTLEIYKHLYSMFIFGSKLNKDTVHTKVTKEFKTYLSNITKCIFSNQKKLARKTSKV